MTFAVEERSPPHRLQGAASDLGYPITIELPKSPIPKKTDFFGMLGDNRPCRLIMKT